LGDIVNHGGIRPILSRETSSYLVYRNVPP
jgi:hypothetical protein